MSPMDFGSMFCDFERLDIIFDVCLMVSGNLLIVYP